MPYSTMRKTRILLGDPSGTLPGSGGIDLQGFLDRGSREVARLGLLFQARESIALTVNTRAYALSSDHIQTFSIFRERYSASVRLLAQDASAWWLTVSTTGTLSLINTAPAGNILLNTPDTSWLEILSPDATRWYVYPSPIGGLLVSTTSPATGTGTTSTVQFLDIFGVPWYPAVSNVGVLTGSMTGTATLTSTALNDHALQRVEPEAITRIAPRTATGAPERYAIAGKVLYVHPTPDAAYQLDHKYFSDLSAWQPQAAQYLPALYAIGMELMAQQRGAASQMLRDQFFTPVLMLLATNLSPESRDGLDMYRMAPR